MVNSATYHLRDGAVHERSSGGGGDAGVGPRSRFAPHPWSNLAAWPVRQVVGGWGTEVSASSAYGDVAGVVALGERQRVSCLEESHMQNRSLRRARGQGLVEYALIIALVAVVVIGALILLGPQIAAIFDKISSAL